jgi:DNA-binding HxlR family transcriptional regulator
MSILSRAWAPNVIWHLRAGPRRFSELRVDMPPVSAKVLTQRLHQLESAASSRATSSRPRRPPSNTR